MLKSILTFKMYKLLVILFIICFYARFNAFKVKNVFHLQLFGSNLSATMLIQTNTACIKIV